MASTQDELGNWFRARIPKEWFLDPVEVRSDRDEVLVIGTVAPPVDGPVGLGACIGAFREDTRELRIRLAREAEQRFGRKVAWGVRCADKEEWFTTSSVPVMTRLRMSERAVLDTLIDAGIARSRSEALAWCVRLVGRHQGDWIEQLRTAMQAVERVRAEGPSLD